MSSRVLGIVTIATILIMATPVLAQRAGFQIAIAPQANAPMVIPGFSQPMVWPQLVMAPQMVQQLPVVIQPGSTFGFPTTQNPYVVTHGGFVAGNVFPTGPVFFCPPQAQVPYVNPYANPYVNTYVNPYVNPYVNSYVNPYAYATPTVVINNPPQSHFGPAPATPAVTMPVPGTSRAQVIQQFGAPSVTIVTRSGETLYFNGGVTVIIQNGQVAGPR